MLEIFTKLADWSAYNLLGLNPQTHLAEAVHFFVEDTAKIFFMLTSLMLLVGFFRSWISAEKVRSWLDGKPKILAYFLAVSLGRLRPFALVHQSRSLLLFLEQAFLWA